MLYSLAATLSLFAGLTLFGVGFLGIAGVPAEEMHPITVLLYPSGLGAAPDLIYHSVLIFLGAWLSLCIYIRVPATIALVMVLSKVTFLGDGSEMGVLPALAVYLTLSALFLRMLTTTSWLKRDKSEDISESIW
ncbi:hypothetical protein [Roseovarius amoyensis]|uniref:hypothetical protein n=1 Tax=Roseovarius amoyensis TaxID=2211448 RepID=UPI0013A6D1C5|nr:hypothetical protein [Roseovarius amoyensis]